jgi:diguanylate cyclase (GGDEF)-like protein/PAS domain S-box-containing protein
MIIEDSANFIERYAREDEEILSYLKRKLENSDGFSSIYYGTKDNFMINPTGWVPPTGFDLRTRPWYQNAINSDNIIITDVFENATKDAMILTIAKAVHNGAGEPIGVVSGDISVAMINSIVDSHDSGNSDFSFIIDNTGDIVSLSKIEDLNGNLEYIDQKLKQILQNAAIKKEGIETIGIKGKEGFLSYTSINNTNWTVATFVSFESAMAMNTELKTTYFTTILILAIVLFLLLYLISINIVAPLVKLEDSIEKIDMSQNPDFVIDSSKYIGFEKLVKKINALIEETKNYIYEIQMDKEQLSNLNQELEALFKNSPNAIVLFNENHQTIDINDKFRHIFGYELSEMKGKDVDLFVDPNGYYVDTKKLTNRILKGESIVQEVQRVRKDGSRIELEVMGVPIIKNGKFIGGYGIYTDISRRKETEKEIVYMSYHDQLTGLYNRRFFEEELKRLDNPRNLPLSIIMMDLNGLKLSNDAFGHQKGDELLIKTAQVIKETCRQDEIVSRHGGDEFVILLPKTSEKEAEALLKRIREKSKEVKVEPIEISFSAGIATKNEETQDINKIFKYADDKMYRQKLYEDKDNSGNIINAIIKTLNEKNKREEEHSKRVSEIAGKIAESLGYTEEKIKEVKILGHLHDVGKVGIKESILNKEGKLTEEEWKIIKTHPEIGYRILSEINEFAELAGYVLAHHERCDGKGYPKGIPCDEMPQLSKIISVADAFDAMTSERTYKDKMTTEEAVEELKRNAGTQFDPEIVEAFIKTLDS